MLVMVDIAVVGGNEQPATLVPRPGLDPSCSTPLGRTAIAGKWGDKGYWSKRFGVSVSKGTSKAFKYKALFELQFQVGCALGMFVCCDLRSLLPARVTFAHSYLRAPPPPARHARPGRLRSFWSTTCTC